jgi:serine/threonine-protein kinase
VGWWRATAWALAGVIAGGLVIGVAVWALMRPEPQAVARFQIPLPADQAFSFPGRHMVAISPDGTRVAYTANSGLWLRPLDQLRATSVSGTEAEARSPFFSPDGQWIGFYAAGQLKKVSVSGGAPVTLCAADNPWGASWGPDDLILYGQGPQGIWRVRGTGGTPEMVILVEKGEQAHGPQMLPGGEWVLFTFRARGVSAWDQAQIVVQSLETGERNVVINGGRDARYVPTGHLVYALNGVVLAVPFDLGARRVAGGPVSLVEGVATAGGITGAVQFSIATNGSLIYALGSSGPQRTLVWVDRQGREEPVTAPPRTYFRPRLSPDGTRVALDIGDQEEDIWIWDLAREALTRFTFDAASDGYPVWTPDGRRLVWESGRAGPPNLFWQAADGTGSVERLTESAAAQFPHAFSPDGTRLLLTENRPNAGPDLALLAMEGERPSAGSGRGPSASSTSSGSTVSAVERSAGSLRQGQGVSSSSRDSGRGPSTRSAGSGSTVSTVERSTSSGRSEPVEPRRTQLLVQTTFDERNGEISPDGRWLAYQSNESGQDEIYVRPFPDINSGRWQISTGGGTRPLWARSKELFYVAGGGVVMSVPVEAGVTFRAGNPIRLFEGRYYTVAGGRTYDVSPDGQRFLMLKVAGGSDEDAALTSIIVVENWFEELKRLVPTR